MHKILIVEDEKKQLDILIEYFRSENFDVLSAEDGISAVKEAVSGKPDILLLDIMLPEKNGFDVCREIREKGLDVPIIMLTAKSEEIDKVMGLELGADDYITKPFSLRELHARVRAQLRRTSHYANIDEYKLSNNKIINFKTAQVEENGKIEKLSKTEVSLLKYFIKKSNVVLSRNDILNNVWGYDYFPESRTLDAHIVNLRRKIEEDYKNPRTLLTVHGLGYKFAG
ncbi:MAG: response regulator transcription factor [bacterium]|nr:response regulator transcription factor [bacterium]